MTDHEMKFRWRTSLHEAGHSICTFAYSGEPCGARLTATGGNSDPVEHLPHPAQGIALAAGAAAEPLAEHVPPPALTFEGEFRVDLQRIGARLDAERVSTPPKYAPASDSVQLGWWAVERNPDCPELWPASIAWARAQAAAFVSDNGPAIVALAKRLFERGKIDATDFEALALVAERPSPQAPAELAQLRAEPARSNDV